MSFGPPPSPFTQSQRVAEARRSRRVRMWAGAVLALVAVVCVGGWFLIAGSPEGGAPGAGNKAAVQQAPDDIRETVEKRPRGTAGHLVASVQDRGVKPNQNQETPGTWATDKVLVKGNDDALQAVEINSDDEAWSYDLTGPVCGWTKHVTVDGRTAILFKDKKEDGACNQLALFDLDSGKKLWQVVVPWKKYGLGDPPNVTMTSGVVSSAWGNGSAGYDMASGKRLWERNGIANCREGGFAGGKALLLRLDCTTSDYEPTTKVVKLDPRTGKERWRYDVAEGVGLVFIVSSEPPVLAVSAGEDDTSDLISLDERGKYRATVRLDGGHYEVNCSIDVSYSAVDNCNDIAVGGDQVFITSGEEFGGSNHHTNRIVSFDLGSGKPVVKFEAGPDQMIYPVRMSGGQLLAFRTGTDNYAPFSLVSLDPRTGKEKVFFYFTVLNEAMSLTYTNSSDVVVQNGRIFFGGNMVRGESIKGKPVPQWLAFGVGSAG
ncbi:outer membrane protein assembly factor BamB family protein [Streptomyces sp. NBC_01361]|uniref:outer membrane protein assembly factor BamB family protein n=1 Tax=Streptomyces sp. NBC_01361 TaxID=2903838 RepID=UPI002E2FF658|nr:PQQ-binding-like beta-propeller repeat protein [Streptomyces sp. NBC_01361]